MNVLSMFDGISCGHAALDAAGIPVDKYYASETDKFAIRVTQKNYPDTVQLGDVRTLTASGLPQIDLLIGGSPCQGFSAAGVRNGFSNPMAGFFWDYVRLLYEAKPKYFLYENVLMPQECQDIISTILGEEPIMVDSSLISAARRRRLYWTNIPGFQQPKDKHIMFGDIRERGVENGSIYYSEKLLKWIKKQEKKGKKLRIITDDKKMQMLEATMYKKCSLQRFFAIEDVYGLRYITVKECERCMGLPDGYTAGISNSQAYRHLGNGLQVDTVASILKGMKEESISGAEAKKAA